MTHRPDASFPVIGGEESRESGDRSPVPQSAGSQPLPPWARGGPVPPDPRRELIEFWRTLFAVTPRVFVSYVLVAANVAVLAWMVVNGVSPLQPTANELLAYGANFSPATAGGQWWRLATSMFLHVGLVHLLVNMWALWNLGPLLERFVGNAGFALVYVLSGVAGGLASITFSPGMVSAGASGAIFGLLGAIVGFVVLRRDSVPPRVFWGMLYNGVLCVAINVVIGVTVPFIDNAAHLGGLAAGFVCGLFLSRRLDPAAARGRWRRNILLAVIGGTAVAAVAAALAERNLLDEILWLRDRAGEQIEQYRQNEIAPAALAEMLETDILPAWQTARQRVFARLQPDDLAPEERRALNQLAAAMQLYEEGWRELARGLRQNDPRQIERGLRLVRRGDGLL